jgi:hypothetical protein
MRPTSLTAVYVAGETLNFLWSAQDVVDFDRMWRQGVSVAEISTVFNRDPDEVVILVIDRVHGGYIHKRSGGVYGNKRE